MNSQFSLMATRRFLPLFIVQFLGAFNDNLLKTVLVVLIAYGLWDINDWNPAVLVAVASGLFILPFILFTPLAGSLSDKYDKAMMIRWIKLAEIVIALFAIGVLFIGDLYLAFGVLVALGAQSAFFSPVKFSILPQHLKRPELVGGNALVSSGTYLAILSGTIVGAIIAPMGDGKMIAAAILMAAAIVGYVAARFVPPAPPPQPDLAVSFHIFKKAAEVIGHARAQKAGVFLAILGTAYFYFVASTFHAQFPNFTKTTLGADNIVLTMFMVVFSVGIVVGGLLNHRFLNGKADGVFVPLACVLMAAFGIDIYFAAKAFPAPIEGVLMDPKSFITHFHGARLIFDTFLQAVACGFYVIPLRAIVQDRAAVNVRSRVISSSNMMEALMILAAAVLGTVVLSLGVSIEGLYLIVSILTLLVGLYLFKMPSLRLIAEEKV